MVSAMNAGSRQWLFTQRAVRAAASAILAWSFAGNAYALSCSNSSPASRMREVEVVVIGRVVQFESASYASISKSATFQQNEEPKWEWEINKYPSFRVTIQVLVNIKGDRDTYDVLIPFFPSNSVEMLSLHHFRQHLADEPWLFYISRRGGVYEGAPSELRAEVTRLNSDHPEFFTLMGACSHNAALRTINVHQFEELRTLSQRWIVERKMSEAQLTDSRAFPAAWHVKVRVDPYSGALKSLLLFLEGLGLIIALLDFTGWSKRLQDGIDHYRFRYFFWFLNKKPEQRFDKIIQVLWFPAFGLLVAVVYGLITGGIWWFKTAMLRWGITFAPFLVLYVCPPLVYNLLLTINRSPYKAVGFASLVIALSSFILQRITAGANFHAY